AMATAPVCRLAPSAWRQCRSNGSDRRITARIYGRWTGSSPTGGKHLPVRNASTVSACCGWPMVMSVTHRLRMRPTWRRSRPWSTILYRVADARLVLRTHQFNDQPTADRIRTLFALHGVSPDRIALFGSAGHRELMDKYNEIDIVLDPFPYAGGLTTCESLWMGVPAITLAGETFASRHSFSHTSNVGLTDWQAADVDAYCDLAVAKAADLGALAELRAQLRPQMRASPLCNTERFGQSLAAGLRYAWREWCLETEVPPLKSGRQDRILALSD